MARARKMFGIPVPTTVNREGYPAYERPLRERYLQVLLSNTVGNVFYATANELLQEANAIHDEMLQRDPEFAAKALVFARNEGFMRLQPTFGLAKLAAVDRELFERVFDRVILIPSDLQDFFCILQGLGRGQGGRLVKRNAARWLESKMTEYWAIKYNGRGRGFSLGDIIATVHPKPSDDKKRALFAYLRGREYNVDLLPQVAAFERLKRAETEEERVQLVLEGKLPHEVVTGSTKMTPALWEALLPSMPLFALLRHLRTMERAGVFANTGNLNKVCERLSSNAIREAKILPFRLVSAYNEVENVALRDALQVALETSCESLPDIPGRTAIFLDVSGSMQGQFLQIGSVFALALFKKTRGSTIFWTFNTEVHDPKASLRDSILGQASRIEANGGTDTGVCLRELCRRKMVVDNIIIITDEQQNSGSPFIEELNNYRRLNPDVRAFVVDVAPYMTAMVPPQDTRTWFIYGWSDTVLQFISMVLCGMDGMVATVDKIQL